MMGRTGCHWTHKQNVKIKSNDNVKPRITRVSPPRPAGVLLVSREGSSPDSRCSSPRCRARAAAPTPPRCTRRHRRNSSASTAFCDGHTTVLIKQNTHTHNRHHTDVLSPVHQILEFLHGLRFSIPTAGENLPTVIHTDDSVCCVDQETAADGNIFKVTSQCFFF